MDDREQVFLQWWADYRAMVCKIARAFAERPQDQEDLLQDILVRLWQSIPVFQRKAGPSTWVYRVALNTALAWKRGAKRHRLARPLWEADVAARGDSSAAALENREALDRLYAEIRRLPAPQRSLILLHLDGCTHHDIAQVLGASEGHVAVKLTRARKLLAERMKGTSHGP